MIRVLLCGSIPPEWGGATGGGVASFHRTFIEELLARGDEYGVEIAGLFPFNLDPASSHRPPVPDVFEVPAGASDTDFYARMLAATRADVVVFQHITHRWAVYHGQLVPGVPALGVIHSWNPITFRPPEAAARVRQTLERALPACDRVVFVSEHSRVEGESLGFVYPSEPVVINNPLGPTFVQQLPVEGHDRQGWVFVGSLIDRKNPMTTLEAAARCGQRLTFIGEGAKEGELKAAAVRLGIEDQVTFVGWAPPERVRDFLLRAELLCLPSLSESFSLAYLEALACGTPIVGAQANMDELGRRLGVPCGAAVREGTVDEVVGGARWVQASPWDRPELRRRALEAFSPSAVTSAYVSVLHDMVGKPGGTRPAA